MAVTVTTAIIATIAIPTVVDRKPPLTATSPAVVAAPAPAPEPEAPPAAPAPIVVVVVAPLVVPVHAVPLKKVKQKCVLSRMFMIYPAFISMCIRWLFGSVIEAVPESLPALMAL